MRGKSPARPDGTSGAAGKGPTEGLEASPMEEGCLEFHGPRLALFALRLICELTGIA